MTKVHGVDEPASPRGLSVPGFLPLRPKSEAERIVDALAIAMRELITAYSYFESAADYSAKMDKATWVLAALKALCEQRGRVGGGTHVFSINQAAERVNVSARTVMRAMHRRELAYYRYGKRTVVIELPGLRAWRPFAFIGAPVPPSPNSKPAYHPEEVAVRLGVSVKVVRMAMSSGRLKFRSINDRVKEISDQALQSWRGLCRREVLPRSGASGSNGRPEDLKVSAVGTHDAGR